MTEPDAQIIGRREKLKKIAWVTVLNDDDTFTGLDGCWIAFTSAEQRTKLDEDEMSVDDLPEHQRFALNDLLMIAIDSGIFDDWLSSEVEVTPGK